ncbi:MAG: hypothetical protein GEV08_21880 [Acidimicrobiia bacterium]|nr:hypothetical protein [Acidimicrobiia bacterium]
MPQQHGPEGDHHPTYFNSFGDILLRGWGAYFRSGNSSRHFAAIDNYVRQRIARLASIKYGLTGINWGNRFDYTWLRRLGIYELSGTVRYRPAHALR